jgi:hypothetical protein
VICDIEDRRSKKQEEARGNEARPARREVRVRLVLRDDSRFFALLGSGIWDLRRKS